MSNNNPTVSDSKLLKSPGQLLREQRLKLAIDARQAADYLKITRTRLAAIEADNHEIFSSSIYVRGHLRNYARFVNVSESEIMDCYYAYIDSLPKPSVEEVNEADEKKSVVRNASHFMPWRRTYALVAGIILLSILIYPFISQDSQQQAATEKSVVFEDPAVEAVLGKIVDDEISYEVNSAVSVFQGMSTSGIDIEEVDDQRAIEPVDTAPIAEIDQLVLSFTDDCWLEVTDAEGIILAAKLHRAGDRLILRGSAPFNVLLGNVAAAEVNLNGKEIAVTPIGSQRTLRFTVGNT